MAGATVGAIRIGMSVATAGFEKDLLRASKAIAEFRNVGGANMVNAATSFSHALEQMRASAKTGFGVLKSGAPGVREALSQAGTGFYFLKDAAKKAATGIGQGFAANVLSAGVSLKRFTMQSGAAIAQLTALGAATVAGAFVGIKSALKSIDDLGDSASRIGTTTDALGALRYATQLTGSEASALDAALLKMNSNLADAASKGGPAADALGKMGLKARDLIQLDPSAAFTAIAGGFAKLPNDSDRAAAALDIFGKSGASLLNTLKAGPAEIGRLADEAKKLGIAFTDLDASKAGAANDALDKMSYVLSGLVGTVAVSLAPVITSVVDEIVKFASSGVGAGISVEAAIRGVGVAAGIVSSVFVGIINVINGFAVVGVGALTLVLKAALALGKGIEAILNLIPGVKVQFTEGLASVADVMDRTTAKLQNGFTKLPYDQVTGFFDGVADGAKSSANAANASAKAVRGVGDASAESAKKIGELVTKLRDQVATFGMSSAETEVYKLKQAGATEETLREATALSAQIKLMEEQKKVQEEWEKEGKKVFEDVTTPLEKYGHELEKLKTLKESGLIDGDTFNRAETKAKADLDKSSGGEKKANAAALELGSKEERSALLSYRAQSSNDPIKEVAKSTADAATSQRAGVDILTKIASYLAPSNLISLI